MRRSQKRGVVVSVPDWMTILFMGSGDLNDDSPVRQGCRNATTAKISKSERGPYAEFLGRCDFVCAYFGDELVGFMQLVYRGNTASILHLTTKASHLDKRPANALIAKAVEVCEEKRHFIPYFRKVQLWK